MTPKATTRGALGSRNLRNAIRAAAPSFIAAACMLLIAGVAFGQPQLPKVSYDTTRELDREIHEAFAANRKPTGFPLVPAGRG